MFDINQVITDHINSIKEPGVRDWLTNLHKAKAFYFSVDAVAYYQYQQQDMGCLSYGEMKHILSVLEAIDKAFGVAFEKALAEKATDGLYRYMADVETEFPPFSVGGLAVDAGLYRSNGGAACDNLNGPCSSGAWHKGDTNEI